MPDTGGLVLAHGLGGRSDLPVPLWLALYAGAAAVLVSFFALTVFWQRPKLRGPAAGAALPRPLASFADARATRIGLRAVGVVLLGVLLAAAWFGTGSAATNPAATWFYVWFWVGLVPVSLLFGPIWRLVNPLRALAAGLRLLPPLRGGPAGGSWRRPLPERLGYWPATAGLVLFLWLELVYSESADPRAIAVFVTVYALVHAVAGAVYGPRWFDTGESFEVYAGLIGALAPIGRREDGVLVLRNPLDGLLTIRRAAGLTGLVLVVLGSTAFDGLTRLPVWSELKETAGLIVCIAAIAAIYAAGIWLTKPYLRRSAGSTDAYSEFAHALVPIMVGYTVAHYFSFAVFQGQAGWLLAGDPFGLGWDLLGTAGSSIDYTVVSTTAIALVQIGAIVLGHIVGVTAAHDKAVGIVRPNYRRVGQYPMLAVMVAYTVTGIALVSGG